MAKFADNAENQQAPAYHSKRKQYCDITDSENEFHTKYNIVINNIVHRKMSAELQKYLSKKCFGEFLTALHLHFGPKI